MVAISVVRATISAVEATRLAFFKGGLIYICKGTLESIGDAEDATMIVLLTVIRIIMTVGGAEDAR